MRPHPLRRRPEDRQVMARTRPRSPRRLRRAVLGLRHGEGHGALPLSGRHVWARPKAPAEARRRGERQPRCVVSARRIGKGLIEQLDSFAGSHSDLHMVIVDTFQTVRTPSNQTIYSADYEDMGALKAFADEWKIAMLVVHHTRKMGDGDRAALADRLRGRPCQRLKQIPQRAFGVHALQRGRVQQEDGPGREGEPSREGVDGCRWCRRLGHMGFIDTIDTLGSAPHSSVVKKAVREGFGKQPIVWIHPRFQWCTCRRALPSMPRLSCLPC